MQSIYNFWANYADGFLLFNGRTGGLIRINNPAEKAKIEDTLNGKSHYMKAELERAGFLWQYERGLEVEALLRRRTLLSQQSQTVEIIVSPTYGCNFRCTYCYVCFDDYQMNAEDGDKIVKYLKKVIASHRQTTITWFGGEPLLMWEKVAEISQELRDYADSCNANLELLITTNGYLLSGTVMKALYAAGIRWLHVTIDGCDAGQDTRRVVQGGGKTYQTVLDNFINAMSEYPDLHGTLRMNLEPDSIDLANKLLTVIPQNLRAHIQVHPTPVILDGVERPVEFYTDVAKVVGNALDLGYAYYPNDVPIGRIKHCNAECCDCFQIGPKAELFKCSPSNKPEVYVGDIDSDGVANFNEKNQIWQDCAEVEEQCKKCKFLCFCQGGCRLNRLRGEHDKSCKTQFYAMPQHIVNYMKWLRQKKT